MTFPEARTLSLPASETRDGRPIAPISLSVHEAGSGPAVVFSHGFPELAYSWRHQFPALVEAGYRVVAPDQRGYGGSDRPDEIEAYDIHHLTSDMVGVLDALEIDRAVFVGHDWGGFVVWAMPLLHPERTAGVVGVNTPYMARPPQPPTAMMRMLFPQPEQMYILWFQEPGVADPVLQETGALMFDKLLRSGVDPAQAMAQAVASGTVDMNPFRRIAELDPLGDPVVTPEELEVFVSTFARTGFTGGVNWYRNLDRNWETFPESGVAKIEVPSLMVCAEWDLALRPEMADGMPDLVPDLERVDLPKCGHWTQQEQPEALNRTLLDWLGRRFPA